MRQLLMTAVLVLLTNAGSANAFSWDAAKEERALQRMKQFQLQYKVPTVAMSISIDGKILLARGTDSTGSIVPEGEKIRYHIGSVTKHVTAAAILALIEDGTVVPSS